MIDNVFSFFEKELDTYIQNLSGANTPMVSFLKGEKMDPPNFEMNTITPLLINLEEENQLRDPNRYLRSAEDGTLLASQPDIRLNLFVLFIARFSNYLESLKHLSWVLKYFQANPLFVPQSHPSLPAGIEKLYVELITLPFSEQNEVWNALRTTYLPSVLYKVRMIVIRDEEVKAVPIVQKPVERKLDQK